jgi:hypothetical protein
MPPPHALPDEKIHRLLSRLFNLTDHKDALERWATFLVGCELSRQTNVVEFDKSVRSRQPACRLDISTFD